MVTYCEDLGIATHTRIDLTKRARRTVVFIVAYNQVKLRQVKVENLLIRYH